MSSLFYWVYFQGETLYTTPLTLINFYLVPYQFRVVFQGMSMLGWAIIVSAIQHELPDITRLWVSETHEIWLLLVVR